MRFKIKEIMVARNLTIAKLAQLSGVKARTLEEFVKRGSGNVLIAWKIAKALNVTIDELIEDDGDPADFDEEDFPVDFNNQTVYDESDMTGSEPSSKAHSNPTHNYDESEIFDIAMRMPENPQRESETQRYINRYYKQYLEKELQTIQRGLEKSYQILLKADPDDETIIHIRKFLGYYDQNSKKQILKNLTASYIKKRTDNIKIFAELVKEADKNESLDVVEMCLGEINRIEEDELT